MSEIKIQKWCKNMKEKKEKFNFFVRKPKDIPHFLSTFYLINKLVYF